jgi:cell division initiation protein
MEKYINTLRNDNDVFKYLDEIMNRLSKIESENVLKDRRLYDYDVALRKLQQDNIRLLNQVNYYKQIEASLNNSMAMVKNVGEQIKNTAYKEREAIIDNAKAMASRILNEALIKSERINAEADRTQRNLYIYKNKVRSLIECQLDVIDDIEKIDI